MKVNPEFISVNAEKTEACLETLGMLIVEGSSFLEKIFRMDEIGSHHDKFAS